MRWHVIPIVAVLMSGAVAVAAEPQPPDPAAPEIDSPGDKARRGLDLLMQALEGWIDRIPSYAPPEVTPEGDIIIRRLDRPRATPLPPPAGEGDAPPAPGGATRL